MCTLRVSGLTLTLAMLAACGGSQPPVGEPGAMTQRRAIAQHAARGDLLYVAGATKVYIFSYPQGKLVNAVQPPSGYAVAECADPAGNVWVGAMPLSGATTFYEYAHGGITPIAELSDPGEPEGCSVDPTSGDLAVTNAVDFSNPHHKGQGDLAVYTGAQGDPKMYYPDDQIEGFFFCSYDDNGNLYLSGANAYHINEDELLRLTKGSGSFEAIGFAESLSGGPSVEWRGKDLYVSSWQGQGYPISIYRLHVSGSKAVVGETSTLNAGKDKFAGQVLVHGHLAVASSLYSRGNEEISFWAFPKGGNPKRNIRQKHNLASLWGLAVSHEQ